MGKYLTILLLCFSTMSFGQYSNIGTYSNPNDTARGRNLLIERYLRMPLYAPSSGDTIFLSSRSANGMIFSYSLQSLLSRIGSYIGVPGLQAVIDNGSDLDKNNDINLSGFQLRFFGGITKFDDAEIGNLDLVSKAEYTSDLSPFSDRELPDVGYVKGLITDSLNAIASFDYIPNTTITSLTDSRIISPVSCVLYAGFSYNSAYFSQTGTMITFLNNLKFHNGQKITIVFK